MARNLTDEEWQKLSLDLTEVFKKHNVDMSVRSEIVFVNLEPNGDSPAKQFEVKETPKVD